MKAVVATATRSRSRLRRLARQVICLVLLVALNCSAVIADTTSDRRASVGLNLFRALLIADQDIAATPSEQPLDVYILYADDDLHAEGYRDDLATALTEIRNTPVQVHTLALADYLQQAKPAGAGVFISQRLSDEEIQSVIRYAGDHQQLLFSPYEGDVERGVLAGISVQAVVRPYINLQALKQSGIRIKSFYLKVAKTYE